MQTRNAGLDHIRIVLTVLVVLHHTAIAYGGSGDWYWRQEANASNLWLVSFNAINQAFFMGFFFLLSGYFSAMTYSSKGSAIFLRDRFIRLGIPLLVYFVLLSPVTVGLATAKNLGDIWPIMAYRWRHGNLGPGPLWFAEALLLFSLALVLLYSLIS